MLNTFRDNLKNLRWVLWLTALAMTLYLGQYFIDSGTAGGGAWAVRVEGKEISPIELRNAARNLDRRYQEQLGGAYDQLKSQIRLGSQAAQQLIDRELILADARRRGIAASKAEIAEAIRLDPALMGEDGKFVGVERYRELLRANNYPGGVAAYEQSIADSIVLSKWQNMILESVSVGQDELRRVFRERNERVALDYFVLPRSEADSPDAVTDDEARAWYDAHPELYEREAGRRVRYATIQRNKMAEGLEITDAQIQAEYDASIEDYTRPEQRRARHILIRVAPDADAAAKEAARAEAQGLLDRVLAGEDLAGLARTHSDDPGSAAEGGDLDFFSRGDMVPPFDRAAFETPVGEVAPLVETQFGFHVIEVTDAREAGAVPLEDVRDDIRRTLRIRIAEEKLDAEAARLRDAMKSSADLTTVAEEAGLRVDTVFVTEGGRVPELGAGPGFSDAVFATDVGAVGPPQAVSVGRAIFAVEEEVAAGVAPFEEVKNRARSDLLNDLAREAAVAQAREALAAAGDLAAAASRLGQEVRSSGELAPTQDVPGTGGLDAEARDALFAETTVLGDRGVLSVPAGALVYEVTSRTGFDEAEFYGIAPQLETELERRRGADLLQSVMERLEEQFEVERNDAVIAQFDAINT